MVRCCAWCVNAVSSCLPKVERTSDRQLLGSGLSLYVHSRARCRFPFRGRAGLTCPLDPFSAAVPLWGQTSQIPNGLSPKRDCGSKRVPPCRPRFWAWARCSRQWSMYPPSMSFYMLCLVSEAGMILPLSAIKRFDESHDAIAGRKGSVARGFPVGQSIRPSDLVGRNAGTGGGCGVVPWQRCRHVDDLTESWAFGSEYAVGFCMILCICCLRKPLRGRILVAVPVGRSPLSTS